MLSREFQKDDKSGRRLQAISNFFHNLGSNKRGGKNGEPSSTRSSPESPQESSSHSSTPNSSAHGRPTNLPPITQDSKGRLTTALNEPNDVSVSGDGTVVSPRNADRPRSAGRVRSGRPGSGRGRTFSANSIIKLEDYKFRHITVGDLT